MRRNLILSLSLMVTLFLVSASLPLVRGCTTINQNVPLRNMAELVTKVRLEFPPGCTLVEGEWRNSLNTFGYAKVRLPPDGWREFLRQPPFNGSFERSHKPVLQEDNPVTVPLTDAEYVGRWHLTAVRESVSASGGQLNGAGKHMPVGVFIDLDHPNTPIAYLNWYD